MLVVDATDCVYGGRDGIGLAKATAVAAAALGLKLGRAVMLMRSEECAFRYSLHFAIRQAMSPSARDRNSGLVYEVSISLTNLLSIPSKLTLLGPSCVPELPVGPWCT